MSSKQTGAAEQTVKIADLFSKCSQLAAQEEKEMGRLVGTMLPVLAYLDEPVTLRPGSLGGSFAEFNSVTLQSGAVVVTRDFRGMVSSKPLAKFNTADCLAILKDAFPELNRLVADKKRTALVRPMLSMRLLLGGQRFILDKRSYRLLVSNSGWDCVGLGITAELPDGRTKSYREVDVSGGGRVEVDLGVFKEVEGEESLKLRFDCNDVDGRELCGEESLRLDGEHLQEAPLSRKKALGLAKT